MTEQNKEQNELGAQSATADVTAGNVPQGQLSHVAKIAQADLFFEVFNRVKVLMTAEQINRVNDEYTSGESFAECLYVLIMALRLRPDAAENMPQERTN